MCVPLYQRSDALFCTSSFRAHIHYTLSSKQDLKIGGANLVSVSKIPISNLCIRPGEHTNFQLHPYPVIQ